MTVKIMEVCKVTPPPESVTEMSLPLTFFDLLLAESKPVEHLLFYEDRLFSASALVSKLKKSLSLTLKHFLPFAGNITWPPSSPKPILCYERGDGIMLTVAHSNDDFYHLSSKKLRESKILHSFIAHIAGSDSRSPLVAVKVIIFPNSGFCIGITNHSVACDGKAITMFLKTWASISKFGKSTEQTPVFDRNSVTERYADLENSYIEALLKENGTSKFKVDVWKSVPPLPDSVRGTFPMSGLQVRKLKELITARLANVMHNKQVYKAPYISTFVATYAFVVLCIVKAKTIANNKVRVLFHYDCRSRLEPPLSADYVGNCIGACFMYFDKKDLLGKDGLMMIVNSICISIIGLDNNGALRAAKEWLPNIIKQATDTESMEVYVSGSSRFEFHNIDFGWGRPLKADIMEKGSITFIEVGDSRGGGKGIECDLCLSKVEMENFVSVFAQELNKMMPHTFAAL